MRALRLNTINLIGLVLLVFASSGNASLIQRANGLIYDDVLDITWIADPGLIHTTIGTTVSWHTAVSWADNLVYAGYSDWRLASMDANNDDVIFDCSSASTTESQCRDNEYGYMYEHNGINWTNLGGFGPLGDQHYWSGTENPVFPNLAYLFNFSDGFQGATSKITTNRGAWAVRNGDVAPVPIPAAFLLFGSGLFTMLVRCRRVG